MTLLGIGRSGQVATALRERAEFHELNYVGLGRPDVDLLDIESCKRAIERYTPSVVINAAAYTKVEAAETEKSQAMALNASAPGELARICKHFNVPLIHISTDYVFDGQLDRPYCETDATRPIGFYGQSKLDGENAVRAQHDQHIILRTSWVYSPFGANFVKTMLRLAKERGGAGVVDDQYGTPTSALDIADTIFEIARQLSPETCGTYHFTSAGSCSWADFAALVFSIYDEMTASSTSLRRISTEEFPTPTKRPKNSRLATQKLTDTFAIKPRPWTDAVTETVRRLLDPA